LKSNSRPANEPETKAHYLVYHSMPLEPVINQINPVHTFTQYCLRSILRLPFQVHVSQLSPLFISSS